MYRRTLDSEGWDWHEERADAPHDRDAGPKASEVLSEAGLMLGAALAAAYGVCIALALAGIAAPY